MNSDANNKNLSFETHDEVNRKIGMNYSVHQLSGQKIWELFAGGGVNHMHIYHRSDQQKNCHRYNAL